MPTEVEARPASTVILARPLSGAGGPYELFMVRRPVTSEFAADVYVFPGGGLRADDLDPAADAACAPFTPADALRALSERGGDPPAGARAALGLYLAALRELHEEAGVLLAEPASAGAANGHAGAQAERLGAARVALQAGRLSLAELAAREGLRLLPRQLVYLAHWITPRPFPRRYDTRFFLAAMPPRQEALHCNVETVEGLWITPRAALARHAAGTFPLVPVTARVLAGLAEQRTLDELFAAMRTRRIASICPEWDMEADAPILPAGLEAAW